MLCLYTVINGVAKNILYKTKVKWGFFPALYLFPFPPPLYLCSALSETFSGMGHTSYEALSVRSWFRCILQMYIDQPTGTLTRTDAERTVGKCSRFPSVWIAVTILYSKNGIYFQLITKCIFVCISLLLPNYKMYFFTWLVLFLDVLPVLYMTNLSQTKIKELFPWKQRTKTCSQGDKLFFPPWRTALKNVKIWSK